VQIHLVTKEEARDQAKSRRWEYEVNESNERKVERKTKEKYRHPKPTKNQYTDYTREDKEHGTIPIPLSRSSVPC
jgi:hypothetical protein